MKKNYVEKEVTLYVALVFIVCAVIFASLGGLSNG